MWACGNFSGRSGARGRIGHVRKDHSTEYGEMKGPKHRDDLIEEEQKESEDQGGEELRTSSWIGYEQERTGGPVGCA